MKKKPAGDTEEVNGKRSRGMMLPAAIVAAAVLVAGFLMQGGAPAAAPDAEEPTPHPIEGPVVAMDPVTLNLLDGSYLKVGVALQLSPPAENAAESEEGAAADEGFPTAKASDAVVATFTQYTKRQLSSPRKRAAAKKVLSTQIVDAYGGKVSGIYFTSFVMQ